MRRVKPFRLSRRTMLRGLAGGTIATVALPMLEAMLDANGEALASGAAIPKRFITYHFGNGVILDRWVPTTTGTGYALPELLAPLAPVKPYVNVLSGFKSPNPSYACHVGGFAAIWFAQYWTNQYGYPYGFDYRPINPSHDQVAADHISTGAPFRSLEISTSKRDPTSFGPYLKYLSWKSKLQPNSPIYSPKAVFQKLFGVVPNDATRTRRVNVLDAVKEEAASLRLRLGTADRAKLEAHLTSLNELQSQVLATAASLDVTEPAETNADVAGKEPAQSVTDCFLDLVEHAFIGDLTRVVSWMGRPAFSFTIDSHLGQQIDQHGSVSHSGNYEPYRTQYHNGILWHVQTFSNLMQRLAAAQEGSASILDHTVATIASDISEGWTHLETDLPIVMVGGAGLKRPGQHVRYLDRSVSDVGLTMLKAVAPSVASVGIAPGTGSAVQFPLLSNGFSTTPVSELLL